MNRRGLLRRVGGLVVAMWGCASVSTADTAVADVVRHGPWVIRWSGWHRPFNQRLLVGTWTAHRPDRESDWRQAREVLPPDTSPLVQDATRRGLLIRLVRVLA